MSDDGMVQTKGGLMVPEHAVEKRRVVLGLGLIRKIRGVIIAGHRQRLGFVMLCHEPACKHDPICVRTDTPPDPDTGTARRTEFACGCTVRVIPGGL